MSEFYVTYSYTYTINAEDEKSAEDKGYKAFKKELETMPAYEFAAIVEEVKSWR